MGYDLDMANKDYYIYYPTGESEYDYFEVQFDDGEFNGKIYGYNGSEDIEIEEIDIYNELKKIAIEDYKNDTRRV